MKDVRYVMIHRPGPAWVPGAPVFEQPGVAAHVAHFRAWLESGKLALGGPFLDAGGGGMMIAAAGVAEADVHSFAMADPAVAAGLLTVEVRIWLIGMQAGVS